MRKCLLLIFSLIIIAAMSNFVSAQNTPTNSWSSPVYLGHGWWQSMALDREGNVHVGWSAVSADGGDVLDYATRNDQGQWDLGEDKVYNSTIGMTVRNAMAATSDGILHVAFRSGAIHFLTNVPVVGALNARNWSSPIPVDNTGYYLDMIADTNDNLHLAVSNRIDAPGVNPAQGNSETSTCFMCHDLFYRRSTDGGRNWSDLVPISTLPDTGSDRVKIMQGASGRLYIAWTEGIDWYMGRGSPLDVRFVYSNDDGLTWSNPIILDGGNLPDRRPLQGTITELLDGSIMVVWRYSIGSDSNIYFQLSSDIGKTWTPPKPVTGILARPLGTSTLDHYALVTDKLGEVHLFAAGVVAGDVSNRVQLLDVAFVPSSNYWLPPQIIFRDQNAAPEWPQAVVGPSNDIHVTWFSRQILAGSASVAESDRSIFKLYYSERPGNLPIQPTIAFRPTLTPLPTATVFQDIKPTSTPFPTVEGVTPITISTTDNYAAQTFLGGMFMAALFCGTVILFLRLRR